MNKISFSQLESARRNPSAFAKSLIAADGNNGRFSKFMAWQLSVFHYHKERSDLAKAINYFESTYIRNFADNSRNNAEKEVWIQDLQAYANDDLKKDLAYIEHKKRISIPLTTKIRLGGELPLIKLSKIGYSVYFFSRDSATWESELRFPIVQDYVANTLYNVDLNKVEVGVYSLELKKHLQKCFSPKQIEDAVKELSSIGRVISKAL